MLQNIKLSSYMVCLPVMVVSLSYASFANATDVDNSNMNKPAQTGQQLNAENQGSSKTDIELARKIRREVMNMKNVSTYAKNVKIIVIDGNVTLKGPVKTDDERKRIAEIAADEAGSGQVVNQIDIKQN